MEYNIIYFIIIKYIQYVVDFIFLYVYVNYISLISFRYIYIYIYIYIPMFRDVNLCSR